MPAPRARREPAPAASGVPPNAGGPRPLRRDRTGDGERAAAAHTPYSREGPWFCVTNLRACSSRESRSAAPLGGQRAYTRMHRNSCANVQTDARLQRARREVVAARTGRAPATGAAARRYRISLGRTKRRRRAAGQLVVDRAAARVSLATVRASPGFRRQLRRHSRRQEPVTVTGSDPYGL